MGDNRKGGRAKESLSPDVMEVLIQQALDLADEAKRIALSAKSHDCAKESDLSHLKKAIDESKEAMGKISDTNIKVVEELGRWKWFRVLIMPLAFTVITTAAGAFATFMHMSNDIEKSKVQQKATDEKLEAITAAHADFVVNFKKREKQTQQTEFNMKTIAEKLEEIAKNTKEKPKPRRRQ